MSAIAGVYHTDNTPVSREQITNIMDNLSQFPADDIKCWVNKNVFLGCHAQWITSESINEPLPYYDSETQVTITADAIIDNREELLKKLNVDSRMWEILPDSQLILLAYYKWGEDTPKYLIGDFAFMIWDQKKQLFFGATDPSGYRTFYYYHNQKRFAFCTIIEPLLSIPYIEKKLNEQWLAQYLAIMGMSDTVDACSTPYKNIKQIPPFHYIKVTKEKVKIARYGFFNSREKLKLKSDGEYVEAFQEVFQRSVTSRLRTYRNVGSHLSGGLDSGSVVGFAGRLMQEKNKPLHTFSYVPTEDFTDYTAKHLMPDERPFIKKTVAHVGGIIDHYYDFKGKSSYTEIDELLDVMEMPYKFLENSFWLKGIFEKANENEVGVLLNGDRGNFTISWGPAINYYGILLKKLRWFKFYQELTLFTKNVGGSRLRLARYIGKSELSNLIHAIQKDKFESSNMLINPDFAAETDIFNKLTHYGLDKTGSSSVINVYKVRRSLYESIFPWNSGNTLNTKLSLRYGLWKRDPTNDIRVIRFCLSIPENQYVQKGLDRALIRRSTKNILPDEIRLNQFVRGAQGADWIHRMIPDWSKFTAEVKHLSQDKQMLEIINGHMLSELLKSNILEEPKLVHSKSEYSLLMRCIIVYRFLKKFN